MKFRDVIDLFEHSAGIDVRSAFWHGEDGYLVLAIRIDGQLYDVVSVELGTEIIVDVVRRDRRVKDDPHVPQWEERRGR